MTVSHLFINREVVNAEINVESYRKEIEEVEKKRAAGAQIPDAKKPDYSQDDPIFSTLMRTLALSTTTFFQFEPKNDEAIGWYIKKCKADKVKAVDMPKKGEEPNAAQKQVIEKAILDMIAEEKAKRFLKRQCKGDASETGIIRFLTPAIM